MSDNTIILQPQYVADFQCDGSQCNAKCCGNKWKISIDVDTYKKYQRIKNHIMRKKILSSIKPSTNRIGFEINFGKGTSCPLLCEDNLCYVQLNLGEEALSNTCKGYPRVVKQVGKYQFRLLSMTCPVAAEKALFYSDGTNIQQLSIEDDTAAWKLAANRVEKKSIGDDLAAIHVIMGGLSLLQNDYYTFEQRLVLLGLFLDRVEDCQQDLEAVAGVIDYYNSHEFQQEISSLWDNWQYYETAHKQFMTGTFKILQQEKQLQSIAPWLVSNINYDILYEERNQLVNDCIGNILERYWQHEWIFRIFPFALQGSFLHNYFAYVIAYEICQLYIYSTYDLYKTGDRNDILEILGSFSKMLDHREDFLNALVKKSAYFEREPLKLMQVLLRLK
mgnify:FL=1